MSKFLTKNWSAKIACIILAILLWMYSVSGLSKVGTFPGSLAIEVKNVPNSLVAIPDQELVKIKIIAEPSVWNSLSASSFSAYVDMEGKSSGVYDMPVQVISQVQNVQIVEKDPNKILVRLEPQISKNIPIKTKIEGQAGEGLAPGETIISPQETTVTGAKSIIDKINEATARIVLTGEKDKINKTVKLSAYDATGNEIKGITFSPSEVQITIPFVKAAEIKTVGIEVTTSGKPKSGYWISLITTDPATLTITGSAAILAGTNSIKTEPVSIEGIWQTKNTDADIIIPSGLRITEKLTQVKVQIQIQATISSREVTASYKFENLDPKFRVTSADPSNVRVTLTGPVDVLSNLNTDNIILKINLADIKNSQEYSIQLGPSMFSIPGNLQIANFIPTSIKIKVSQL